MVFALLLVLAIVQVTSSFFLFGIGQGNSFCATQSCSHIYNGRSCSYWNPAQCSCTTGSCPSGYTLESGGTKCYILRTGQSSWSDASARCMAAGDQRLATITSSTQQTAVASLTSGQQAYIGLSDSATEGTFLWTDGSSLGTGLSPNWASNQPATSGSTAAANQDCVKMKTDGTWDDVGCNKNTATDGFGFVCERLPIC